MNNNLGYNLKYLRKVYKLSQDQLGAIVGKTHAAISRWEGGFREPSGKDIKGLADYFGVSPAELVYSKLDEQVKVDAPAELFQLLALVEKMNDKQVRQLLGYAEALLNASV